MSQMESANSQRMLKAGSNLPAAIELLEHADLLDVAGSPEVLEAAALIRSAYILLGVAQKKLSDRAWEGRDKSRD